MVRRCSVTMVAIEYPELKEKLASLMAHSLTTAMKWYNLSIKDREVTSHLCVIQKYTL